MKHENIKGKIYVSANAYLGRSEIFCRGFCRGRLTAICRRVYFVFKTIFPTCPIRVLTFWVLPFRL